MAGSFQGDVSGNVVANLLQYFSSVGMSGCLTLEHTGTLGALYLEAGTVVHAELAHKSSASALAALLLWHEGRFTFEPEVPPPEYSLQERPQDWNEALSSYREQETLIAIEEDAPAAPLRLVGRGGFVQSFVKSEEHTPETQADLLEPDVVPLRLKQLPGMKPTNSAIRRPLAGRGGGHLQEESHHDGALEGFLREVDGRRDLQSIALNLALPLPQARFLLFCLLDKGVVSIETARPRAAAATPIEMWSYALTQLEAYLDAEYGAGRFRMDWLEAARLLADDHPCLDPWLPDVTFEEGRLKILSDDERLTPELLEGVLAAVQRVTAQYRLAPGLVRQIVLGKATKHSKEHSTNGTNAQRPRLVGRGGHNLYSEEATPSRLPSVRYSSGDLHDSGVSRLWTLEPPQ